MLECFQKVPIDIFVDGSPHKLNGALPKARRDLVVSRSCMRGLRCVRTSKSLDIELLEP